MKKKRNNIQLKRKRAGKTNYRKRLKLLMSGKPRLVIRKSLNNMMVQIIKYYPKGDKVILCAHSRELNKFGWTINKGNIPAAYLTGFLLGIKAKGKGVDDIIVDAGLEKPSSKIYAALNGVLDAGLKIPHSKDILVDDKRVRGEHIKNCFANLKEKKMIGFFSNYSKVKINPSEITEIFDKTKNNIKGAGNNGH